MKYLIIFSALFLLSCEGEIKVDFQNDSEDTNNSKPSNDNSSEIVKTLTYSSGNLFSKHGKIFTFKNEFNVRVPAPTLQDGGTSSTFSATGLPSGLAISSTTGEITGKATSTGTFNVQVEAKNGDITYRGNFEITIFRNFEFQNANRNELTGSHLNNGVIVSSGDNRWGAFGDGTLVSSNNPTPLLISNILNSEQIVSYSSGSGHTCGLTINDKYFCFGWGQEGQLGNGALLIEDEAVLVDLSAYPTYKVRNQNIGWGHSAAIISELTNYANDKLLTWGDGSYGALGLGNFSNQSTPQLVSFSPKWPMQVVSAYDTVCVLLNDFTIKCSGKNNYGQLGDGTTNDTNTFVDVDLSALASDEFPTRLVESTGKFNGFFTNKDKLYMFGSNGTAQMGQGDYSDRLSPIEISIAPKSIVDASFGKNHALVLTADNLLYASGEGNYGALGNGTTTVSTSFTAVDMTGALLGEIITEIYAGYLDNAVITSSRKLFTWGGNTLGQAGNGTTTQNNTPILIDADIDN